MDEVLGKWFVVWRIGDGYHVKRLGDAIVLNAMMSNNNAQTAYAPVSQPYNTIEEARALLREMGREKKAPRDLGLTGGRDARLDGREGSEAE
jgi:hypothetical protein